MLLVQHLMKPTIRATRVARVTHQLVFLLPVEPDDKEGDAVVR